MSAIALPSARDVTPALALSAQAAATAKGNAAGQARATAQDFEAVFLNSMFSQMFTGMDGEGPLGGGPAVGVWRSFLTQEYARSFAKNGGIGIADHVYRALIGDQAAQSAQRSPR